MHARWYAILLGFLLLALAVMAFIGAGAAGVQAATLISVGIVWLITAAVALWYGFGVREGAGVRSFAGIVGGIYLLWGIVAAFVAAIQHFVVWTTMSLLLVLLGALGVASSLVPTPLRAAMVRR